MMASIHFMRGFINDYQGTWEGGLRYILESAPVFFFIAFGMTALHSVSGPRKWRRLLELGIISLLHQLYQKAFSPFQFDFFLFLWFMLLIIAIFRRLFLIRLFRLAILVGIIIFNLLIGHGQVAIFGEHPFGPIPWAFCLIIGMMIGLETQTEKQRIRLAVIGAVLIVCAYAILWLAPNRIIKMETDNIDISSSLEWNRDVRLWFIRIHTFENKINIYKIHSNPFSISSSRNGSTLFHKFRACKDFSSRRIRHGCGFSVAHAHNRHSGCLSCDICSDNNND
jgi:hypothetical protein